MIVGILHPGAMGAAVGGAVDAEVRWASHGRSAATRERAQRFGIRDVESLDALVSDAEILISICPPHAALDLAREVAALGFDRIFVDANAISPGTAREVGDCFRSFVDGGIVGPPPIEAGSTRLYLAGAQADFVAEIWRGSPLEARVLPGEAGAASALKMAYAGWTKGSAALLLTMRAFAESQGVGEALTQEWSLSVPDLPARVQRMAAVAPTKAWRYIGEMTEIAASLASVGLPDGFFEAARDVYEQLDGVSEAEGPALESVLRRLLETKPQ